MYYDELYHHGIKGQRWGVRRFQNKDGSLTRLGQKRADRQAKAAAKEYVKSSSPFPEELLNLDEDVPVLLTEQALL